MMMGFERWFHTIPLRLRSLFRGSQLDRELDEELRDHIEQLIRDRIANGASAAEARQAALRTMDGVEQRKEECRDTRRVNVIEHFVRDLRYGARVLARSPGFTGVAVVSLALGIGANTAIFQLLDAVRLRALPVANAQELVTIQIGNRGWPMGSYNSRYPDLTAPQWDRLRDTDEVFSGLFAWAPATFDLASRGESRFAENGLWVSGSFFDVLGVRPLLGRVFTAADDFRGCPAPGVVVSHAFWTRELGGLPSAVGTTLTVKGHPFEVIGVTPAGFFGVEVGRSFDLAVPLCADLLISEGSKRLEARNEWWLAAMGRLRGGVSPAQATARLEAISPALFRETLPPTYDPENANAYLGFKLGAQPGASGFSKLREEYDRPLRLLLSVAGVVLLIACANVANLMLARMGARRREMSVRLAIGASRGRLVRQLLAESLLLATLGAACGVWLARALGRSVVTLMSSAVDPMFIDLSTDWRMLAVTATLAAATCLLFGVAPALRATRVAPGEAMKGAGRSLTAGRSELGLRRGLVVVQVALSLILLVGGLLFGRSLFNLLTLDAGFRQQGVLEADVDLTALALPPESSRAVQADLVERIRAIPDVDAAATASVVPLVGNRYQNVFFDSPQGLRKVLTNLSRVGPGYFKTLATTVVAGREFEDGDTLSAPAVALVNESFVRQFLGGDHPVGITFRIEGLRGQPGQPVRVVGLVRDTKYGSLRENFKPVLYLPDPQNARIGAFVNILIRSRAPLPAVQSAVKRAIESANPDIAFHFHDFQEQIRYSLRQDRLMALLCGFFAVLGAVLATIGVYGVMSYSVTQRGNEIGIRLALGADGRSIVGMILGEASILLGLGLVAGVALALVSGGAVRSLLFGLEPQDPATFAAAIALLAAAAAAASYLPARRASRVDPMRALRCE